MYASFLRISRALHLDVFEQPVKAIFQQPARGKKAPSVLKGLLKST